MDCSPLGSSSVHGISQAKILVAIPFSRGSSQLKDRTQFSHISGRFFPVWATITCCLVLAKEQNQVSFPGGSVVKNLIAMQETSCNTGDADSVPGLERFPGEGNDKPTPVFLPGKSHGQRSLMGSSLWDRRKSGTWLGN